MELHSDDSLHLLIDKYDLAHQGYIDTLIEADEIGQDLVWDKMELYNIKKRIKEGEEREMEILKEKVDKSQEVYDNKVDLVNLKLKPELSRVKKLILNKLAYVDNGEYVKLPEYVRKWHKKKYGDLS